MRPRSANLAGKNLTLHWLLMASLTKDLTRSAAFVFKSLLWVFPMIVSLYDGRTVENKDNTPVYERITSTSEFSRIAFAVTPRNASAR